MDKECLDLYTDYLISSFGQTTATGLATLLGEAVSHDRISRFLRARTFASADLWQLVKPLARQVQSDDGLLIFDDTIEEKPYTDESELICWHFDHTTGRNVKGINLVTALYYSQDTSLPVAFELVKKPLIVEDSKTGRPKRKAQVTKNELYRRMLDACVANKLPFRYVVNDIWYASAENMGHVKVTLHKQFVMPLKSNRNVALSDEDKLQGRWISISSVPLEEHGSCLIWLEGVPFAMRLVKQVFTNEDGSHGVLYLVTSDLELTAEQVMAIYQKRWKVEEFHKSLKSNASLEKSPTKTTATQANHLFASLIAYVKLETLRQRTHMNHFAMKARIYQAALSSAYAQLRHLTASGQFNSNCSAA